MAATVAPEQTAHVFDDAAAAEFAGKAIGYLNAGSVATLLSIGHQTELFDTMAGLPPSRSDQIAAAAGLNERYVREWLSGLAVAQVISYDPDGRTFWLPPEHAAFLTRAAGPNNVAGTTQMLGMFGEVEQQIVGCFRAGGGLPYSAYSRFHEIMAGDSAAVVDSALLEQILPLADGIVERLASGIDVADIGCGRGHAINVLGGAYPASRLTGFDFSPEAIGVARDEASTLGLTNVGFQVCDVATLDLIEAFDLILAFDSIHDQAHPRAVLANIYHALRRNGTFMMRDVKASSAVEDNIDLPWASFLYAVSTMHCMSVSLGLGGEGLGTAWGEQLATDLLYEAGFADVQITGVDNDPFNSCYIARKPT
jgi:SAM-dependent methyltransferase